MRAGPEEYRDVWILAEQRDGKLQKISFELLTRGRALADRRGCRLQAMIFGNNLDREGLEELILRGADRVLALESPLLEKFLVEPYAECMVRVIERERPEILIAGATSTGRTLMPYVAMKIHTGLTADCTGLDIEEETKNLLQIRPAIGGNIMATIKTPDFRPQMATVRPGSTPVAPLDRRRAGQGEIILEKAQNWLDGGPAPGKVRFRRFTPWCEEKGLVDAERVVVVGRGIKRAENIALVRELADVLDAALGATRDVVDRGWLPYAHQIGLSGKTITPRLYIGVGVSGAIQHLAGMQTSELIVAINNDPDAQIFRVADIGIVGDLFQVVPALIKRIKNGDRTIRL